MTDQKDGVNGRELAVIVAMIAVIGLIFLAALLGPRWGQTGHVRTRMSRCASNFKQMGLSLKMYANESRGEKYPRPGYYYDVEVDCTRPIPGKEDPNVYFPPTYPRLGNSPVARFAYMFSMDDMYPEYLPDLNVLVCPDDAGMTVDDLVNPASQTIDANEKCAGGNRGWTLTDESYVYLGHTFDKAKDSDPAIALGVLTAANLACARTKALAPTERVGAQFAAWLAYVRTGIASDPAGFAAAVDRDWEFDNDAKTGGIDFNAESNTELVGNGHSNTLYRLREGVERFLMTDATGPPDDLVIPQIVVMWEQTALATPLKSGFNHSPAGSNVLYVDGHVEFIKYPTPDKPPLNRTSILTTQCMQTER